MGFFRNLFSCRRRKKKKVEFISIDNYQNWAKIEQEIYNLMNTYRFAHGKSMLQSDYFCREQAKIRTFYCISVQHATHEQYGVIVKNGKAVGLEKIAENLAYGYYSSAGTVNAFKNSSPHSINILKDDWKYTGVSVQEDEMGRKYVCVTFAK